MTKLFSMDDKIGEMGLNKAYEEAAADPLASDLRQWFEDVAALDQRGPSWGKYLLDPPRTMHAWHCGLKPLDAEFRDFRRHLRTGEGWVYLGPGIYFATERSSAEGYCRQLARRGRQTFLYDAMIDTSDFIDWSGRPRHVLERLKEAEAEAGVRGVSPTDSFRYGKGQIGAIVEKLGDRKALDLLIKHGVRGQLEWVHTFWEIAVYDTDVITPIGGAQWSPAPQVTRNPRRSSRRASRRSSRRTRGFR